MIASRRFHGYFLKGLALPIWAAAWALSRVLIGLALLPVAALVYHFGERLSKPSADEERRRDPRPPVLLLRAFQRDGQIIRRPFLWIQLLFAASTWDALKLIPKLTFEEALANILRRIGPTITMGHPAKPVEPAGASRMYAGDGWRSKISEAAQESALVAIITDDTPSLRWELQAMAERPGLRRVLLVLPPEGDGMRTKRSPAWYRAWNDLRRDVAFLPEATDSVAAFWFDERGRWRPIEGRSASAHDQLRALDDGLTRIPELRRALPQVSTLGWPIRRSIFHVFWLLAVPLLMASQLSYIVLALSRTNASLGILPHVNTTVLYMIFAALAWTGRLRLPLAKVARIGIDVDPLRTYAPHRRIIRRTIAAICTGMIMALTLRALFVEAFKIPSGSMIPSLMIGDHIFVDKLTYGPVIPWSEVRPFPLLPPTRGDVMVFKFPENKEQDFIKRVIAVPGDTLEVINGRPLINGWLVPHCYVGQLRYEYHAAELYIEFLEDKSYFTVFEFNPDEQTCEGADACNAAGLVCRGGICGILQGPFKAAEEEVWVMGDNRNNSHDSRSWNNGRGGGVPFENIKGRAMFVWMSFGPGGGVAKDRIFVNVHGDPKLPAGQEAALRPAVDRCLRERPPLAQTTPPPPRRSSGDPADLHAHER